MSNDAMQIVLVVLEQAASSREPAAIPHALEQLPLLQQAMLHGMHRLVCSTPSEIGIQQAFCTLKQVTHVSPRQPAQAGPDLWDTADEAMGLPESVEQLKLAWGLALQVSCRADPVADGMTAELPRDMFAYTLGVMLGSLPHHATLVAASAVIHEAPVEIWFGLAQPIMQSMLMTRETWTSAGCELPTAMTRVDKARTMPSWFQDSRQRFKDMQRLLEQLPPKKVWTMADCTEVEFHLQQPSFAHELPAAAGPIADMVPLLGFSPQITALVLEKIFERWQGLIHMRFGLWSLCGARHQLPAFHP